MTGTNGSKSLELVNGARYRCDAASDDGGRSFSVTDLFFDELRQQQEWSPWMALTNTTNAKFSSQVIAVSNAGEAKSVVLNSLQDKARAEARELRAFLILVGMLKSGRGSMRFRLACLSIRHLRTLLFMTVMGGRRLTRRLVTRLALLRRSSPRVPRS